MSWSKDGNRKLSPDSCGLGQLCVWFWPQEALFAGCWGSWREGPWGCLVKAVGLILHRASKAPGDFFPLKLICWLFPLWLLEHCPVLLFLGYACGYGLLMIQSLTSWVLPWPKGGWCWRWKGRRGKRSGGSFPCLPASVLSLLQGECGWPQPLQPVLQGPSSPWPHWYYLPFFLQFSGANGFSPLPASEDLPNSSSINKHFIQFLS